jgi:hypothetical protein
MLVWYLSLAAVNCVYNPHYNKVYIIPIKSTKPKIAYKKMGIKKFNKHSKK